MKSTFIIPVAVAIAALVTSCEKKQSDVEACVEGKWSYTGEQIPVYLEIDGDKNAKYYAPNSQNYPFCGANLTEVTFKLDFQSNVSEAVVRSVQKNTCYGSSFAFVEENDLLKISCYSSKLNIVRNDTTTYLLKRQ